MNLSNLLFIGLETWAYSHIKIAEASKQLMIYDLNLQVREIQKSIQIFAVICLLAFLKRIILTSELQDVQSVVDLIEIQKLESNNTGLTLRPSPKLSQQITAQLQEYQVDYLDCAVSGGPAAIQFSDGMIDGKHFMQ